MLYASTYLTIEHFSAKSKATSGTLTISLTVSKITTYFEKMAKLAILAILSKFWKMIKFTKYGALTYDNPCDPKFLSISLYLLPFQR